MKPTPEQQQAIDIYSTGESLRIEALAGTGKTTTLRMLVDRGSPRGGKILYTSFGSKVVKEAKAKFPKTCRVVTNHGMAWGIGVQYQRQGRLQLRLTPFELSSFFGWNDSTFAPYCDVNAGAYAVLATIAAFCQSDARTISAKHAMGSAIRLARIGQHSADAIASRLADLAAETWGEQISLSGSLAVLHDVYLKQWALSDPRIDATTILVDESQDSNPLMVDVLRKQTHAQLVVVGDRRQAIYGFRGAVNAMDAYNVAHSTHLTQSFRFGPEIAAAANAILVEQCASDVLLSGDPAQPGAVSPCATPHCYLGRTNAALIGELFDIETRTPGYRVGVVGGVVDLMKLVEGAGKLKIGQRSQHPDLAEFPTWPQVEAATQLDGYEHLRKLVTLVNDFGADRLLSKLETMRGNEADPAGCDVLLSTAHQAKGLEFDSVCLLDDFKVMGPPKDRGLWGWTPEEGNLLYVAATRARKHLDVSQCEAVLGCLGEDRYAACVPGVPTAEFGDDPWADTDQDHADRPERELAAPPALLEGLWDHPLIDGGKIQVVRVEEGMQVVVTAAGYQLFQAYGDVELGQRTPYTVDVTVGTAQLQVPPAAVG